MPGEAAFTLDSVVRFIADEKSIQTVNNAISQLKHAARTALGAIGVGFSLRELNRMSEEFRSIQNSMKAVFGTSEELQDVQEKIKETTRDVRGEYDKIASNVTDLVKNNRRVFDIDTANRFTDIMYKLTKMSGGNNSQASAAVQSLSSAMRNGKIDRGAIDQLINNVPQAIKVLTSYYGVSQERLRSMAQAGLIRSAQIRDAFLQAGQDVDEAFKDVQLNITDVLGSFRSEFMAFIGETDEMLGISKALAKIIQQGLDMAMKGLQRVRSGLLWLSDKLGGMENVLKLLAILAGSFFVAFHFKEIISGLKNVLGLFSALGLKGMALVAVIALIALLIDDFYHFMKGDKKSFFGDLFDAKGIDADEIRKKVFGAIEQIATDAKAVWEEVQYAVEQLGDVIGAVFSGIKTWWENGGGDGVAESVTVFKNAIIDAWQAIKDWWDANGDATLETLTEFGENIGKAFEGALGVISSLFSLIVHILSGDEEKSEEDLQRIVEQLGLFLTGVLDAVFGEGFTADALDWGEDLITNFVDGIKNGWQNVKDFLKAVSNDIKRAFGIEVEEEIDIPEPKNPEERLEEIKDELDDRTHLEKGLDILTGRNRHYMDEIDKRAAEILKQEINDADMALRRNNAQAASQRQAERIANNNQKYSTTEINFTQNNEYHGDAASQKNVANNVSKATETGIEKMTHALDNAY